MNRIILFYLLITASIGLSAQSVGLIGSATPGGWDMDTDMVQDAADTSLWTLQISLTDGEAKFRLDDDWAVNWGSDQFPMGIGEQDGANIPVFAGDYSIIFNSTTGEYNFDVDSDIGIIGDATPGGWDADTDMYKDQTDVNKFFIELDLAAGGAKFRKDDDWATNWGGTTFPEGEAVIDGENIPVNPAGFYVVTLDTLNKTYSFESSIAYGTIGIIGDATPGGWDIDTDMTKDPNNGELWTLIISLTDGELKFRAEDDWADNWGGPDFPTGTATKGGDNIPVTAGDYFVTFNSSTGEYDFQAIVEYATVGIIGDATPGGWDTDTDLEKSADDPHVWSIRMNLTDGEAKFRADDDWADNWGAGDFPAGVGDRDGANIPITAGDYIITFNSLTGAYSFREVVEYGTVGIIGVSGPFADWDNDTPLDKNADDFNIWSIGSITLSDYDPDIDGGIKFRAENDWAVNWGVADFPAGVGVQDGPNIEPIGGTYAVSFNSSTGEYMFAPPSDTEEIIDPSSIKVFPNPTSNMLNIELEEIAIEGLASLNVIDMSGKEVLRRTVNVKGQIALDVSSLNQGSYMIHISNSQYMIGKRFSINR